MQNRRSSWHSKNYENRFSRFQDTRKILIIFFNFDTLWRRKEAIWYIDMCGYFDLFWSEENVVERCTRYSATPCIYFFQYHEMLTDK